ncbi:uncharacterized protein [Dermacentor andersoni]|uniref:uncharacterized protein n=1 Tax=Dermacentor andersoni TaxID=34620 RepID=UPI002415A348|nr:uncharacterized protein LOC129385661 [Dermacentor andersoni]
MTSVVGDYAAMLSERDRQRYEIKTKAIGMDPFTMRASDCIKDIGLWPCVDSSDIHEFLVLRTSFTTRKQLKARKALEAHNFVTSGWVHEPSVKVVSADTIIIITKVNHSQSLNQAPLTVWVLAKSDRDINAAHCTCMAGNGEACAHVAAVLFFLAYGVRGRQERSCTDIANAWLPAHVRKVEVRPVAAMDFASSALKKCWLDCEGTSVCAASVTARTKAPAPTKEEWNSFFGHLLNSGHRPVVVSTDPTYSDMYVPAARACNGADLRRLYDRSAQSLSYDQLARHCSVVYSKLQISDDAVSSIEARTRQQSMSTRWFAYRAGRITASTLYDVCHTRLEVPSISLLKRICYPHENKASSPALRYGRQNESNALGEYKLTATKSHQQVQFKEAGLLVSQAHIYLGATPHMLVQCACCGEGLVEVKCPWKVRDGNISDLLCDANSCVVQSDGALELKSNHRYYYPVQLQMFVWQRTYCDFVLWNKNGMNVQRVKADFSFVVPLLKTGEKFSARCFCLSW